MSNYKYYYVSKSQALEAMEEYANQFKVLLPSDADIEKEAELRYPITGNSANIQLKSEHDSFINGIKYLVEWLRSQEGKKEGKWHY